MKELIFIRCTESTFIILSTFDISIIVYLKLSVLGKHYLVLV